MSGWTGRVPRPQGSPEVQAVNNIAQSLHEQARHAGWAGPVLQNIANVAFVVTAGISCAVGAVHLYRALARKHPEPREGHPPALAGQAGPPRHRPPRVTASDAGDGERTGRRHRHHEADRSR